MKSLCSIFLVALLLAACAISPQNLQNRPKADSTSTAPIPATSIVPMLLQPTITPTATPVVIPTEEILISAPIDAKDSTFNKLVVNSPQPVIVDFWAPWCLECKPLAETLEKIANDYAGTVIVVKVNVDENSDRAHWYGVKALPAVFFFVNGNVAYREVGSMTEEMVRNTIAQYFGIRLVTN